MTRSSSAMIAVLAVAALALTGCGSTAPDPASPAPSGASGSPPGTAAPTGDADASDPAAPGILVGTVGTDADPDAFAIALTDENGEPVGSVPAGDYTLTILDPSDIHNFRLTGEGLDVASDVGAIVELEFEITLEPGTYEFVCDPHMGTMRGQLEVTD